MLSLLVFGFPSSPVDVERGVAILPYDTKAHDHSDDDHFDDEANELYNEADGYHVYNTSAVSEESVSAQSKCSQKTKQKSIYATFIHDPPLETQPALEVAGDVIWDHLDDLRKVRKNGIYNAWKIKFVEPSPGGYFGPTATNAKKDPNMETVLFSLWDHKTKAGIGGDGWLPALPASDVKCYKKPYEHPGEPSCCRNCQDCAVHSGATADDGSTGTQCKTHIPAYTGQRLRSRIKRVDTGVTQTAYGKSWTGDVWEVSVEDMNSGKSWVVGKQLLAGAPTNSGLRKITSFYEFLGCTKCDAFDATASRAGPWVLSPPNVKLMGARSQYPNKKSEGFTCHKHDIVSKKDGEITMSSGPSVADAPGDGDWDKELYKCPSTGCPPPTGLVSTIDTGKAPPQSADHCLDSPAGWKDSYGDDCEKYQAKRYCDVRGGVGAGWKSQWGPFSKYAKGGYDATTACCMCGGGFECSNPIDRWVDSMGDGCDVYVKKQWCTLSGGYGTTWRQNWGTFAKYGVGGVDATQACCACGAKAKSTDFSD